MDITLVTQASTHKLPRLLNLLERWQGPISCAIYITSQQHISELLTCLQQHPHIQERVTIHLYFETGHAKKYPINILRNVALFHIESDYFFANDIDFMPDVDAYRILTQELRRPTSSSKHHHAPALHNKTLWVLPAFERFAPNQTTQVTSLDTIPKTKPALLQSVRNKHVAHFHSYYHAGHIHCTNYTKWYDYADFSYRIQYQSPFEPYVIGHRQSIPPYWAGFRGFGLNKASWFVELHAAGYTFEVLGHHFVVHMNHVGRQGRTDKSGETQAQKALLFQHLQAHYGVTEAYLTSGTKW